MKKLQYVLVPVRRLWTSRNLTTVLQLSYIKVADSDASNGCVYLIEEAWPCPDGEHKSLLNILIMQASSLIDFLATPRTRRSEDAAE